MKVKNKIFLFILLSFFFLFTPVVFAEDEVSNEESEIYINTIQDTIPEEGEETPAPEEEVKEEKNEYYYTNQTTGFIAYIDDQADLIHEVGKQSLLDEMKPLTKYGNIVFLSVNTNNMSTSEFVEQYYHSSFDTQSGSVFIIDMDNREIYIYSDGENYQYINEQKALSITDNTYTYASKKDYYQCASIAFKQMKTTLEGGKIMEPMRYASNIFIALALSLYISFLFVLSQTTIQKASASEIIKNCDVDFKMGKVTATKNGQKKVFSPVSSSSGGGSYGGSSHSSFGGGGGGHFGGGGGHSGGGGGHRF